MGNSIPYSAEALVLAVNFGYLFYRQHCDSILGSDGRVENYLGKLDSNGDAKGFGAHPRKSKKCKSRMNEPYYDLRTERFRITGGDSSRIDGVDCNTAFSVLSEIDFNVDPFPIKDHFVSWLGLCPNNQITDGKIKRRSTRQVVNRAATVLRVVAQSLCRSKSYRGALYRTFAARLGSSKAITACAHRLVRMIYRCIKHEYEYVDKGQQYLEQQHVEHALKSLTKLANVDVHTLKQLR